MKTFIKVLNVLIGIAAFLMILSAVDGVQIPAQLDLLSRGELALAFLLSVIFLHWRLACYVTCANMLARSERLRLIGEAESVAQTATYRWAIGFGYVLIGLYALTRFRIGGSSPPEPELGWFFIGIVFVLFAMLDRVRGIIAHLLQPSRGMTNPSA